MMSEATSHRDITWNPEDLDKRPVVRLWPDKFLRLDSASQTEPTGESSTPIHLHLGYSEFKSEPPIEESYEWDEWLPRVKEWHEWVRSWKLGYELKVPDGWDYDVFTGDTWSVIGRDWIEDLDVAWAWNDSGSCILPWLDITFFNDCEIENSTRRITIHVEPIPAVASGNAGETDPTRHIHALQFPTDEIKWDPFSSGDENVEALEGAARIIGVSVDEMRARKAAADERSRERWRALFSGPPADDVPPSARYDELGKQWATRKVLERQVGRDPTSIRLGGEPKS